MLRKCFYSFFTLFIVALGFIIANFSILKAEDFEDYKKLLSCLENNKKRKKSSAEQKREGVVKDIFVDQHNHTRLHLSIKSAGSKLFLEPASNGFSMVEKLQNIQCWLQDEETGDSLRQVRYFTAQSGSYTFPAHEFLASAIELYFFQLPSDRALTNIALEEAYLKGYANRLTFFLSDKTPHFQAHHFKATFNPDKGRT